MADFYGFEADAAELFRQGDFASAQEIFEQMREREASNNDKRLKDLLDFNIATCQASQGQLITALEKIVSLNDFPFDDAQCLLNKILCLNRLGRFDLSLPLLSELGSCRNNNLTISALLACLASLGQFELNQWQCNLLEGLLERFKADIVGRFGESIWIQNMSHVLFRADNRFEDCVRLYEMLLDGHDEGSVTHRDAFQFDPEMPSYLCVAYILTGRNRDAEGLIKELASAEEQASIFDGSPVDTDSAGDPSRETLIGMSRLVHLNLAIGTLYCVKGNLEFGLSRVFKSLEPMDRNLTTHSWQQAKKCILSALDKHCKQLVCIKDELFDQMIIFLMQCETSGLRVPAANQPEGARKSVTNEARYLRAIILTIVHD